MFFGQANGFMVGWSSLIALFVSLLAIPGDIQAVLRLTPSVTRYSLFTGSKCYTPHLADFAYLARRVLLVFTIFGRAALTCLHLEDSVDCFGTSSRRGLPALRTALASTFGGMLRGSADGHSAMNLHCDDDNDDDEADDPNPLSISKTTALKAIAHKKAFVWRAIDAAHRTPVVVFKRISH